MSNKDSKLDAGAFAEHARETPGGTGPETSRIDVRMGSQLYTVAGVAAGLIGALCAVGPKLLPAQSALFASAAARGITPGVLWAVAASMFAIGALARSLGRNLEVLAQPEEQDSLAEELHSDLAQTRTSMQELRVEFVYLKESVANLGRDLPGQIATTNESTTRDAMFRLAASLDQVGARLEQRLRSQHGSLEGTLQEVQQSLQATCEQVTQLQESLRAGGPAPAHSHSEGQEAPAALPPPISLGVLDHLADEHVDEGAAYGAPLPGAPVSYEDKLIQLAHLLADPRVRAAADGITRSHGL